MGRPVMANEDGNKDVSQRMKTIEEVEMRDEKDEYYTDMDDSMVSCFVKKGKKLTTSANKFKRPNHEVIKSRTIKPTVQEEDEENDDSYSDLDSDNESIVSGFVRNGKTKPRPLKNPRQTQEENICRLCGASYDDQK